ncbi:YcxB family protein [Desulfosporosinus sp. FKB]|uniref:YcxB family protein n=1 Tax=Desulfosporosinus sp. FKB TaxID=1969835 RepID=UPI0032B8666D
MFEIINRINRLWVVSACMLIVIVCVSFVEIKNGFSNYYNGLICVFLVTYFIFLVLFYIYPINRYIDVYKLRGDSTFIFTIEKIEIQRKDIQSSCNWSLFNKAFELSKCFALRDTNKALTILPKRSFKSESDIEEFRNILSRKMKVYK